MAKVTIASQPRPFAFDVQSCALLIIDMQRDFCAAGGYMDHAGANLNLLRRPIELIRNVLNEARRINMMTVFTREGHRPGLETLPDSFLERTQFVGHVVGKQGPLGRLLVRGEFGHDIVDELKPLPTEIIVDKPGKGAFYATDLETILRQKDISHLIFVGLTTNCCVESTIREANDRGFRNLIVSDCTASATEQLHANSLLTLTCLGGLFAQAAETKDVLDALVKVSTGTRC